MAAAVAVLALSASARTAFALGGPSPGSVSAQTVKLPSGPGSIRGLAEDAKVSSFTGQVQYSVPVELPAGPGGFAPSLSLGYAGELGNGPLGVGWNLSQAGVRRSTRLGVPAYDATDELEIVGLGNGGELIRLADGTYRFEGQGHSALGQLVPDGTNHGFVLTAADGTIYRLGTSASGRKASASGAQVSFWYLQEVQNVAGQTIEYRYSQAGGEVYLSEILWGPSIAGVRAFRAEMIYETRADSVVSYRTGARVESAQRLDKIKVWSYGGVQRIVDLSYEENFAISRLSQVKVTSADGLDALPPLNFTYATAGGAAVQTMADTNGWALNASGTSLFDVDDDGVMDLLRLTATGHSYRRNLGDRFDVARPVPGADGASLTSVRLLDLTGDSGAEMVWQQGSNWKVFQLGGTTALNKSWTALGNWGGATSLPLSTVAVADLDGDYRMDVLQPSGTSNILVRMGIDAGLAPSVRLAAIDPVRTYVAPGNSATSFPDVNGDGLADAVYLSSSAMYLYLGKGDGTFEKYRDVAYPWGGVVDLSQIRLGDLNRDGLMDLSLVSAGNVAWYRGQANGTVATTPVNLSRPPGTDASVVVAVADANGNGSEDLVWSSSAGMWVLDFAGPTSAGMLTGIQNGLGQTQTFAYTASAQLALSAAAAGNPWTLGMPISIPVTSEQRRTFASGEPARSVRLDVRDGIGTRQVDVRIGDRLIARVTRSPAALAAAERAAKIVGGAALARNLWRGLGIAGGLFLLGLIAMSFRPGQTGRARRPAVAWRLRLRTAAVGFTLVSFVLAGCNASSLLPTSEDTSPLRNTSRVLYYHQGVGAGPVLSTLADGSLFEERRYEPYGAPMDSFREVAGGGTQTGPIDFARDPHNSLNKQTDVATGWSDHGARWMAPELARWQTPDPPVKAPDASFMNSPWNLNPYQYVNQNPILYWDPDGHDKIKIPGVGTDLLESKGSSWLSGYQLSPAAQAALGPIFERAWSFDVSKVTVHFGPVSKVGAAAMTFGNTVIIDRGVWNSYSQQERLALLAHEITHSVQFEKLSTPGVLAVGGTVSIAGIVSAAAAGLARKLDDGNDGVLAGILGGLLSVVATSWFMSKASLLWRYRGEFKRDDNYDPPDELLDTKLEDVDPIDKRYTLDQISERTAAEVNNLAEPEPEPSK